MKTLLRSILVLSAAAAASFAQQWEFGGGGGGSFLNSVAVSGPSGSATAGFQTGAALGGYVGYSQSKLIGGELAYGYLQSNLSLKSGGTSASFSGASHVIHYDLLFKTTRNKGKVQLFAAVGGGMKIFRGTGTEAAYQPLSQYGYFTKTQALKPMASVGGGVKVALTKRVFLRAEVRDYITAFPEEIITPPAGMKYGKLLHDLVPMVSIAYQMPVHHE
jgi:Outer membrane protein beta-barrel domain